MKPDRYSRATIQSINANSIIINVTPRAVVNEEAIVNALREAWIAGFETNCSSVDTATKANQVLVKEEDNIPKSVLAPHLVWYVLSIVEKLCETIGTNI